MSAWALCRASVGGGLAFAFARYPVFRPLPRLRVRHLDWRMFECVGGHADECARDFAVQRDFCCSDKVDDDACAVRRIFDFEFGADV